MPDETDLENRLERLAWETQSDLVSVIANCNRIESLRWLKRFVRSNRTQSHYIFYLNGRPMGYHVFPFLVDMIVRHGNDSPQARAMDANVLEWFVGKYAHFPEMSALQSRDNNKKVLASEAFIRMAFEQLTGQYSSRSLVPRTLYMYLHLPAEMNPRHNEFSNTFGIALERQFRVTLEDMILCTCALGAVANSADFIKPIVTTEVEWLKPYVESDAFRIVRSALSLTPAEYIAFAEQQHPGSFVFTRTDRKLISRYPLINVDGYSIAPLPDILLSELGNLIRSTAYEYFTENNSLQNFTSLYGRVFKDYVGLLLKKCFGEASIVDLDNIEFVGASKADWLVIEGNRAALLECKAQRYPYELKRTGSIRILEEFVNSRISEAVSQLYSTLRNRRCLDQAITGFEEISEIRQYIVFEEHFHFANVMSDFLSDNEVIKTMRTNNIEVLSLLDIEMLLMSNLSDKFDALVKLETAPELQGLPLEHRIRQRPNFDMLGTNILELEFDRFFKRRERP